MKRLFVILACISILLVSAVPVFGADLEGGYYFVADCSLGSDIKFYIPADFASGSLTYNDSGHLFNLTSSTIYLYSPSYPGYTINASRFSTFQYRSGNGYEYTALNITDISDTNVQIYEKDPGVTPGSSELLMVLCCLFVILIGCIVILRR